MCRKEDSSFCFAMGILAGVVGGIVAGVLLAPKSGDETRKNLKDKFDNMCNKCTPEVLQAKNQAMNLIKETKNKIEDTYGKFNDYLKAKQLAKAKNIETNVDEM